MSSTARYNGLMAGKTDQHRGSRFWRAAQEYFTHWAIAGSVLALTGFAPEHWFADAIHYLHIPDQIRALDLRLTFVAFGVVVVVADTLWHRRRTDSSARSAKKQFDAMPLLEKPSIAVLRFQNMSGDSQQDYFADGMADEIITGLARVNWVSVISRNRSFALNQGPDPATAATQQQIGYFLEGGVRKSGNHIRINIRLVDAMNGVQLWTEQYDKPLDDVFALQDEIALRVIGAIEPSLRRAEISRVKRHRPNNLSAYDLVLRALPFVYAQMPNEATKAIPLLQSALRHDPDYATAHGFLGWCLHARYSRGTLSESDRLAAIHHARQALAHGNDDPTSLSAAAFVIAMDDHDVDAAIKLFNQALELSNSNMFALTGSAIVFAWIGNSSEAIGRARRAIEISPMDPLNFRSYHALAIAYFHSGSYGQAAEAARQVVDLNPTFSVTRAILAAALLRLGKQQEAESAAQEVLRYQPSFRIGSIARYSKLTSEVFDPLAAAWKEAGLPE